MRHHSKQFHQTQVKGVCGDTYFVRSFRSNGLLLILLRFFNKQVRDDLDGVVGQILSLVTP